MLGFAVAAAQAVDKPLIVYTGVYSAYDGARTSAATSRGKRLGTEVYATFKRWTADEALPFSLVFETDAEAFKRLASDPISMALVLTRDDVQSEVYKTGCCGDFRKSLVNAGLTAVFYQTRSDGGSRIHTVIGAIPLNGYISHVSQARRSGELDEEAEFNSTVEGLIDGHLKDRMLRLGLEEKALVARKAGNGRWSLVDARPAGIEVGQRVRLYREGKLVATVGMTTKDGDLSGDTALSRVGTDALDAKVANLRGYSEETYQVVSSKLESKKAAKLFEGSPLDAQMAQWLSDFLSEQGKAVLPPLAGSGWVANSSGQMEMVLSRMDGERETFLVPPARHPLAIGLTGLASGVVDSNAVNSVWAYKVWIKVSDGARAGKEFEFASSKTTVNGLQSFEEKDVFRDLVNKSMKDLSKQGDWN
jgi:hypothetical protein